MNVYKNSPREGVGKHVLRVQPGREHDISEWKDKEGNPLLIEVVFKNGCADVPNNLGEYLLNTKQAARSRLILPN